MKRTLVCLPALAMLLTAACGGGSTSPTAPSKAASPATVAVTVAQSATSSVAGVSAVDFASCLSGGSTSACFSASHQTTRAIGAAVTAPSAPTGLSASASGGTVTLTWSAPVSGDPVISYVVDAGSSSGAANLASVATNSTATTFSASGIGAGTYYIRIRALTAGGVSGPPSNEAILVVGGGGGCTAPPNAPTGLGGSVNGSTLQLSWNAPTGGCPLTTYVLQAGTASGLSNITSQNTGNTGTGFSATNVPTGTYFLRVLAANAYGVSGPSNERSLTIAGSAPPPGSTSGTFVGLVSNGDGLIFPNSSACGVQKADIQLALNLSGNAVTGTVTTLVKVSPGGNQCGTPGSVGINTIIGTLSGSTLTFSFLDKNGNPNPGTATVTGNRITGSILRGDNGDTLTFSANLQ